MGMAVACHLGILLGVDIGSERWWRENANNSVADSFWCSAKTNEDNEKQSFSISKIWFDGTNHSTEYPRLSKVSSASTRFPFDEKKVGESMKVDRNFKIHHHNQETSTAGRLGTLSLPDPRHPSLRQIGVTKISLLQSVDVFTQLTFQSVRLRRSKLLSQSVYNYKLLHFLTNNIPSKMAYNKKSGKCSISRIVRPRISITCSQLFCGNCKLQLATLWHIMCLDCNDNNTSRANPYNIS